MDPAPPPSEPYRVSEFKRRLVASSDVERGVRDFIAAYPHTPLRSFEMPYRSARDHARAYAERYREFAAAGEDFTVRAVRTIGDGDARDFSGRSRAHFLACFRDAIVTGGSHLVRTDDVALADFQDDELQRFRDSPELDSAIFAVSDGGVRVLEPVADAPPIDEAYVALLSPHSGTFGHWIWHQMTRFAAALESGALHDMPVLVDRGMPATHVEALQLLIAGRDMPLVPVDVGVCVRVRHAWFGSAPFYVPYLPLMEPGQTWSIVATPPERYLPALRALERSARAVSGTGSGERIFLARRPALRRRMVNAAEIEAIALRHGFAIVYPEELPFAQQLATIRGARYVTGPEGSAMFLNFYASPGTSVAIVDHPYVAQITNYSAPLIENGMDVVALTGRVVRANDEPGYPSFGLKHFADYEIDARAYDAFLASWCAPHRTSGARNERSPE